MAEKAFFSSTTITTERLGVEVDTWEGEMSHEKIFANRTKIRLVNFRDKTDIERVLDTSDEKVLVGKKLIDTLGKYVTTIIFFTYPQLIREYSQRDGCKIWAAVEKFVEPIE